MEAEVEELTPLYSKELRQRRNHYDAPNRAALFVVAIATFLVFLMIGGVRLLAAVLG